MTSNPDVPSFIGYVKTSVDVLRLVHAARQGIIPRITQRLNDSERRAMIKPGAVFVFCVQESQIKRWTDGILWSPSRILDNFLVYREINERTTTHRGHKKPYLHDDSLTRSLTVKSSPDRPSLTRGGDQDTFKTGGLIKKTITVIVQESSPEPTHWHLISYYTSDDIRSGKLNRPSTRADIMDLYIPPHIFRLTTFRVPPMVEIGPDGKRRFVSEGDNVDCEIEDSECSIPASPPWLSPDSFTSPVDNPFHGNFLYPLSSGHTTSASSSVYTSLLGAPNERWPGPNDTMLSLMQPQPREMSWFLPAGPVLSSGHTMSRRQDDVVRYETWSSIHSWSGLPIANGFNGLPLGPTSDTVSTDRSKPLASPIECSSPPLSLADATGESSRTHAVLQGTISALKLIQQKFGLASVPGLPNLVGVVLNISEVVNNIYAAEDALIELAQNAGSFTVTLVSLLEQGSVSTFSDPDSMKSIIEELTKVMNRVLGVVNGISFQRLPSHLPLSASDKVAVDECNRKIALACGIFGIRIGFIAQKVITRIEAKLNQALKTLQESNQKTTTIQRASTY